jgi:hypothetical protein
MAGQVAAAFDIDRGNLVGVKVIAPSLPQRLTLLPFAA